MIKRYYIYWVIQMLRRFNPALDTNSLPNVANLIEELQEEIVRLRNENYLLKERIHENS